MSRTQTKQSTAFFITSLFTKSINYVNSLKHHYQNTFLWVALILLMNRAINSEEKKCTLVKQTIGMAKEGMWHHLGSPANTAGAQLHLCPEMHGSISRWNFDKRPQNVFVTTCL